MIRLTQAVIVEGRYDRIRLSSVLDAVILETGGFRIFKDREKAALIRRFAQTCGIVVMTDSDSAGFLIRRHIKSIVPDGKIWHCYIPPIPGKERRKAVPSKEGTLGVEGMTDEVLLACLAKAGVVPGQAQGAMHLTRADLMEDGLYGGEGSRLRREELLRRLELPLYLSAGNLLDYLNLCCPEEEYRSLLRQLPF
ncbi:MAG: DUF4093 domain-containing protein [Oscillospiraceae bacterium]|nr:DUF4093 domain-containing protein [Oscillospiraceae bacterium]